MKKLLLVLAIGAFVACNNGGSEETKTTDSTTITTTDTTTVPVDTTTLPTDTTRRDSTAK